MKKTLTFFKINKENWRQNRRWKRIKQLEGKKRERKKEKEENKFLN